MSLHNVKIDEFHAWLDSTTVLYWLEDKGKWAQFVRNRMKKIKEYSFITWHYIPTAENPNDLGSRGTEPEKLSEFWFCGQSWLTSKIDWPEQPEIFETKEACKEKLQKKLERGMMMKEVVKSKISLFPLMDKCSFILINPIFIPRRSELITLLVKHYHKKTVHEEYCS